MATQVICQFNKYGYCRYQEMCRKQHINEKCENSSCDRKTCNLRHPKICRFFRENGFCKFGEYCKFIHFEKESFDMEKYKQENENILKKLANIDREIKKLQQKEEDIVEKRAFDEKISELESIIAVKDTKIEKLKQRVDVMEDSIQALEKRTDNSFNLIEGKISAIENKNDKAEETITNNLDDEKMVKMDRRIYILEKRRLGSDFCEYCEMEFMAGSQKERKEKESHIRETHTFKCTVCDLAHKNKEELDMHLITCELYVCSLCNYTHKRLSELRSHCKNKHTRNTIIKHRKMDRENFTKLSCTNYFSEEI